MNERLEEGGRDANAGTMTSSADRRDRVQPCALEFGSTANAMPSQVHMHGRNFLPTKNDEGLVIRVS